MGKNTNLREYLRMKYGNVIRLQSYIIISVVIVTILSGCSNNNDVSNVDTINESPLTISKTSVSAQPLEVKVIKILQERNQGLAIVYSVRNQNKDAGIYRADIDVKIRDNKGRLIFENTGGQHGSLYASLDIVPPNESHEYVYYSGVSSQAYSAEIEIQPSWETFTSSDIPNVQLLSIEAVPSREEERTDGYYFENIKAKIINESEVPLGVQINIVARENGEIVGAAVSTETDVKPGETREIKVLKGMAIGRFAGKDISVYITPSTIPSLQEAD